MHLTSVPPPTILIWISRRIVTDWIYHSRGNLRIALVPTTPLHLLLLHNVVKGLLLVSALGLGYQRNGAALKHTSWFECIQDTLVFDVLGIKVKVMEKGYPVIDVVREWTSRRVTAVTQYLGQLSSQLHP